MAAKTILVTGSNRSIGYGIVQALATCFPSYIHILTARKKDDAAAAIAQLKQAGIKACVEPLVLDITDDDSITAAVASVKDTYGSLDVLINNAGIARLPSSDLAANRASYAATFDTNVTSVAHTTLAFLPLLTASPAPMVINISSARGSMGRSSAGELPPTAAWSYSISKVALNSLTLEFMKSYPEVKFYAANPGHCKTVFNGYKGTRDPLEGANVCVTIVEGEGGVKPGFYETVGEALELVEVPW